MDKILIFGGGGYMAENLKTIYPKAIFPKSDIADAKAVAEVLDAEKPTVIINAAGKTGRPNVDWCERHKEETVRSNITGPLVLLDETTRRNIYFVHIGSGCIYQGDNGGRGFTEDDPPNFGGSFYARTKLYIDQILKDFPVLQLRLRMPFDGSDHPRNLINKLKNYDRILDAQNSITYIPDFLKACEHLVKQRATGIFNVVNAGSISPYEIMCQFRDLIKSGHTFERLRLDDLGEVVKAGRSNCILSSQKLKEHGFEMRSVQEALKEAVVAMM